MNFSDNDAQRLLNVIDERIERKLDGHIQYHWGTVASVDATNRRCGVILSGGATASANFTYFDPLTPEVGQVVLVAIADDNRWVVGISPGNTTQMITDQLTVRYGGKIYFPEGPGNDPTWIETINEASDVRVLRVRVGDDHGDAVDVGDYYFADGLWVSGVRLNTNGDVVARGSITANGASYSSQNYFRAYKTVSQSIANNSWAQLNTWNGANFNRGGFSWNTSTGVLTVPRSSIYLMMATLTYSSSSGGNERIIAFTHGSGALGSVALEEDFIEHKLRGNYTGTPRLRGAVIFKPTTDLNLVVVTYQDSGAALNVTNAKLEILELSRA